MKNTVGHELSKLDIDEVMNKMINYAEKRLINVDTKQLEGKEAYDFVLDTIEKVILGTRKWDTASTNNFKKFLFGCLRSEVSNYLKKIGRCSKSIVSIEDWKYDFDRGDSVIYTNTPVFNNLFNNKENKY